MDKHSLSVYGWIVVVFIALSAILLLLSPYGSYLSQSLFGSAGAIMDKAETKRPIQITVNDSTYGELTLLHTDYIQDSVVEFSVTSYPGYIYDGAVVKNGDTILLQVPKNEYSFIAPDKNVTVTPIYAGIKETLPISADDTDSVHITIYNNNTAAIDGTGIISANKLKMLKNKNLVDTLIINSGITEIEDTAFQDFSGLKNVFIKNQLENIKFSHIAFPQQLPLANIHSDI